MNLAEALRDVQKLAFDTVVLIYFIERNLIYFDRLRTIMGAVDDKRMMGITSALALTEVLIHPLRTGDNQLIARYEAILTKSRSFRLVPVTTVTARRAAEIRAKYNLKTPDAIHIATALETKCDAFLTNDRQLERVTEINVLVLSKLTMEIE